jgi:hypothetical protein
MHGFKVCAFALMATCVSAAALAAPTQVNIADPKATTRAARVDMDGRLAVEDVPPGSYFHAGVSLTSASGCFAFAASPPGKALVVREVRVNTTASAGTGQLVLFDNGSCVSPVGFGLVATVNPPALGLTVVPFNPGLAIGSGGSLSATVTGSIHVDVQADGYTVDSSAVPAAR